MNYVKLIISERNNELVMDIDGSTIWFFTSNVYVKVATLTSFGTCLSSVSPWPNLPYLPLPQVKSSPWTVMAALCEPPHAMFTTSLFLNASIRTGLSHVLLTSKAAKLESQQDLLYNHSYFILCSLPFQIASLKRSCNQLSEFIYIIYFENKITSSTTWLRYSQI